MNRKKEQRAPEGFELPDTVDLASVNDAEIVVVRLAAQEDLARVRPDLDGNEIMRLLGLPPGPLVGKAWNHLKELRLDRGPLDRDEAEAELHCWARDQGIEPAE